MFLENSIRINRFQPTIKYLESRLNLNQLIYSINRSTRQTYEWIGKVGAWMIRGFREN